MTPVTPVPFYPVIYTVVVEAYIGGYYTLPHHEIPLCLSIHMFGCL